MKELIDNFSKQLFEAVEIALKQDFINERSTIKNVVFTGMGGSGIGSKIVAQWIEKEIKVPITFVQNYEIPSCISRDTLVIATSYSGNTEEIKLKAQEIVKVINHTNPVIYAEYPYESVAIRGKQQINENGKYLCRYHTIPEMNHNELLGWGSGNENHSAIFLYNSDMNSSNLKRFELTQKIIEKQTTNVIAIHSRGNNQIEESIYFIHLLDWTSYYLGIEKINFLKKELALKK